MARTYAQIQKESLLRAQEELIHAFETRVRLYPEEAGPRPRLTEEAINNSNWREVCQWLDREWPGGGSSNGDDAHFFSSSGAMMLKFFTYKHNPGDPRVLYMINLVSGSGQNDFHFIFDEQTEIPASLEDYLLLYAEKKAKDPAYASPAIGLRKIRNRIKAIRAEKGYASLAEVYAYVIDRVRAPIEHGELHTDTSEYGESYEEKKLGIGIGIIDFNSLQPGDRVLLHGEGPPVELEITEKHLEKYRDNTEWYKAVQTANGRPARLTPQNRGFLTMVTPPEHHELHTDTSRYDEGADFRLAMETDLTSLGE